MAITNEERINKAIEEQNPKYLNASNALGIWHCPTLSKENFWRLLRSTAEAIMAQRGVYHAFVIDEHNRDIVLQM